MDVTATWWSYQLSEVQLPELAFFFFIVICGISVFNRQSPQKKVRNSNQEDLDLILEFLEVCVKFNI